MTNLKSISVTICGLLLCLTCTASAQTFPPQDFVNLDFEHARDVPALSEPDIWNWLYVPQVFPYWTVLLSDNPQVYAAHNMWFDVVPNIALFGPNIVYPTIEGRYHAGLKAGFDLDGNPRSIVMLQTGLVPEGTRSIQIRMGQTSPGFSLSINSEEISLTPVQTELNYVLFAGDATRFAGQLEELRLSVQGGESIVTFDSITFSPEPIPEPGSLLLITSGLLFLAWKLKHRRPLIRCGLIAITVTLCVQPANAQLRFRHDPSGNLTNAALGLAAPAAVAPTGSQTIFAGDPLSLSVIVTNGSTPISYQWRLNGTNIAGATNATFFVAAASTTAAGAYSVVVSNSMGTVTNTVGDIAILATANTLYGIAYAFGQYVAVGDAGTIVTSSNLLAWTLRSSGTINRLEGIVAGNNMLVAVGAKGTILTSSDGVGWIVRSSGNTNDLKGVAYGTNTFVAVGGGGTTLTSSNGVNWITRTFDYPRLEAITYANGYFVAVGTGGTIWRSIQGISWGNYTWPASSILNAVGFGNGRFIATGTDGLILSSTNASNWVPHFSGTSQALESVLFFNPTFFLLGAVPNNLASTDAASWSESPSGTFHPLYGATIGNNIPVAVGGNGAIVRIPHGLLDHFEWSAITSPKRVNQAFSITVTAKDAANNTLAGFGGSASLSAIAIQSTSTNMILGNLTHTGYYVGTNTAGYTFTPNTDLMVTHIRHYAGKRVSIWRDHGDVDLLVTLNVANTSTNWISTPLPVPVTLKAGESYMLAAYSETNSYFRNTAPPSFSHGTIDQGFASSDPIPRTPMPQRWPLVDLIYIAQNQQTLSIGPTNLSFVNGVANANVSVANAAEKVLLRADSVGNSGWSGSFSVLQTNDLAVTLAASPNPVSAQSNLTYSILVVNAGPNSSTSVNVTNTLPIGVSFISAISSQGTPQFANGKVTCNLGTIGNLSQASITITVVPTNAGAMLTNVVSVARSEAESIVTNNSAMVTTYVPPTISIGPNKLYYEGNLNVGNGSVNVTLSSPSTLAVEFRARTIPGTAHAGSDFASLDDSYLIPPGQVTVPITFGIHGDVIAESDETFYVQIYDVLNASLATNQATITVLNDDGLANQVNQFAWSAIPSPQRTNQSFQVTVTAKDAANNTATSFTNAVALRGINIGGTASKTILTNDAHTSTDNLWLYTLGYEFTPATNLFVTHLRHYFGTKVSLWTSTGFLLASTNVEALAGGWTETALAAPVYLKAGDRYRIAVFSGGDPYFWRSDAEPVFAHGNINQSYYGIGDTFPSYADAARWYMVNLRYSLPAGIVPNSTGNFTNGTWSGSLSLQELGTNYMLLADDANGHTGLSGHFGVYATNDLAITMTYSPAAPVVGSNLIYTVPVMNPGPNSVSGIFLTNRLPAGAAFVSAVSSQGTCTQTNGVVTCNVGTLGNLSSASVTITVTPVVAGLPLTNYAQVVRTGTDTDVANNEASLVLIPGLALSLQLQAAVDFFNSSWQSAGPGLWFTQTNVTHDGIDAAQTGSLIHGQTNWIGTTIRGPGTFSFWWKVSSEAGGDRLRFYSGSVEVANITGEVGWQQKSYTLSTGLFNFRWEYTKDADISAGSDAAWMDQVVYAVPPFYFSSVAYSNNQFRATLNGTNGQRLILHGSSDLIQWSPFATIVMANTTSNLTINPPTNAAYRFYRAVHLNQ